MFSQLLLQLRDDDIVNIPVTVHSERRCHARSLPMIMYCGSMRTEE